MALTYTTYVNQLANLMAQVTTDPNFVTFLPGCIDYAEQRIYRELDLLATRFTDATGTLTANQRTFTLPSAMVTFLVVEEVSVMNPAGVRNPLVNVSIAWMNANYPSAAQNLGVPAFFAMKDNATIIIGPPPNTNYTVEVVGTFRPPPLSSTNTSTILTTMLPDLFIAASMIFASGYMRDFGAQADDPRQATSWETQYDTLMKSADVEEFRKKYMSAAWTTAQPEVAATPPRA